MKKKFIIITMCIAIGIMVIGYAAFSTSLNINGAANITSTWKVVFTNIEEVSKTSGVTITTAPTASGTTATFNVDLTSPGDNIVYQITVENQGTLDAIINDIQASEAGSDAIKFEIEGVQIGDKLAKGTTATFLVTIRYDNNVTSQPNILVNNLTININYVQDLGQTIIPSEPIITTQLSSKILQDNVVQSDESIDFSKISSDTNGKGLYSAILDSSCTYNGNLVGYYNSETDDWSEYPTQEECLSTNVCQYEWEADGYVEYTYEVGYTEAECNDWEGTWLNEKATYEEDLVYYFRGAVENNYVYFAGFYWRIIRINEDGSVRLIYQGTTATATGANTTIGTSAFNSSYNDNAYVGYMYGTAGSSTYEETHANVNDSTIKTVLDEWYQENLLSYSSDISDSGFCNDRSISSGVGYGTNTTHYGAYNRLRTNKRPQFACPQQNDLFTVSNPKGNMALTYPIGLITADEVAYAGGVAYVTNNSCYLYTEGSYYWTMSPYYFFTYVYEWNVNLAGHVYNDGIYYVNNDHGVRPVINLEPSVGITGGDGTVGNPYMIS